LFDENKSLKNKQKKLMNDVEQLQAKIETATQDASEHSMKLRDAVKNVERIELECQRARKVAANIEKQMKVDYAKTGIKTKRQDRL
jgi:predicted  nucleic acid-binding Zn-ribbon protein